MTRKQFIELGEAYNLPIQAFLILLGMGYAKCATGVFFDWRILLFLVTLLLIFEAVNIHNNLMDYLHAKDETYKKQTNVIGVEKLSVKMVKRLVVLFLGVSFVTGAWLVAVTDGWIFAMGALGYIVGFWYSGSKRPINSLPIAETLPSAMSGIMIPLISAHIVSIDVVPMSWSFVGHGLLAFLPIFLLVFSGLLANNTCDLEEDIKNGRRTLVYFIGKKASVRLFIGTNLLIYVAVLLGVAFGASPFISVLTLAFVPIVVKLLKPYVAQQNKKITFPLVNKSLGLTSMVYSATYVLGALLLR
ncbi:MAG: prenyltransferase [Lactobacillales bacterium]|jgi:1,4-dihydroxy-2-naphthoate octaprenyltransferase|nr:prenyltransferase [Lactobacillales bacterium]